MWQGDPNFLVSDHFTLLKIDDPKEILFTCVCISNIKLRHLKNTNSFKNNSKKLIT